MKARFNVKTARTSVCFVSYACCDLEIMAGCGSKGSPLNMFVIFLVVICFEVCISLCCVAHCCVALRFFALSYIVIFL